MKEKNVVISIIVSPSAAALSGLILISFHGLCPKIIYLLLPAFISILLCAIMALLAFYLKYKKPAVLIGETARLLAWIWLIGVLIKVIQSYQGDNFLFWLFVFIEAIAIVLLMIFMVIAAETTKSYE